MHCNFLNAQNTINITTHSILGLFLVITDVIIQQFLLYS